MIPILFPTGFIASLSHPGGNITGLSTFAPELSGKQLELLKEVVPTLSSVAVLGTSTSPSTVLVLKEIELATRALKVKFRFLDVQNPEDIESTFRAIKKERAEAVLLLGTGPLASQRTRVIDLAVKNQLPAVYPSLDFVQAGGLMSYGTNYTDLERRAATYVDKILKGSQARRFTGGAANEVRVRHQSESSEANRPDDSRRNLLCESG